MEKWLLTKYYLQTKCRMCNYLRILDVYLIHSLNIHAVQILKRNIPVLKYLRKVCNAIQLRGLSNPNYLFRLKPLYTFGTDKK